MTDQVNISGLTPEQLQLILRLESIFMPYARRQRIQAGFDDEHTQPPIRFVHYTSADAALKIIKSKRMWMRNTTCMTDYREVQHGLQIMQKFLSDKTKTDSLMAALDACSSGIAGEAIELFKNRANDIYLNTYVTSISEHDDKEDFNGRLSMWRAFGINTARVAIVFRVPRFSGGALALSLMFSPVAYLTEQEAHNVMHEVTQNIGQNSSFLRTVPRQLILSVVFGMFLAAAVCLKHEGFREEREWRAIHCPKLMPSPLIESATEVVGGVPQLIYKLPLDVTVAPVLADLDFSQMFDRLIIGPSPYPWVMYESFVAALKQAGCPAVDNRVWNSNIPIRT